MDSLIIVIFHHSHRKHIYELFESIGTSSSFLLFRSSDTKSLSLQPKLLLYPEVMKSENSGVGLKNPNKRMSPSRIWSVPPPSISTPNLSSQLPSPPSKSPPNSNEDDNPGPIGAKRRKLSLNDCHTYFRESSRSSLLGISDHGASTRSRSVSPSSGDSQFGLADVKSPLLCFDSAKIWSMVQDDDQIFKSNESNKPSDKVCDLKNNEKSAQTLSRNTDLPRIW